MMIPILTFGAFASILTINSVLADTTVTSKTYVDTTRQATIPAAGTNAATPGTTVVTYTNTAGTIGERGICNDHDEDDCNDGDLVTNSLLNSAMDWVDENMPEGATCYEWMGSECVLVNLPMGDKAPVCVANGDECWGDGACCSGYCVGCHTTPCERVGQCGLAS